MLYGGEMALEVLADPSDDAVQNEMELMSMMSDIANGSIAKDSLTPAQTSAF